MRICQLSHVETSFNFLAPLFKALTEDGHEVVAASNLDQGGVTLRRSLGSQREIHKIKVSRKLSVRALTIEVFELARYFRRERFDVVHVHFPLAALQGRLAAALARVPTVVHHAHGFYFHQGTRPLARLAHISMELVLGRFLTDYIITVNEEDHQFAIRSRLVADPSRVIATPGTGVDIQRFRPRDRSSRSAMRRELGVPEDEILVTFIGRLVAEKGLLELAEAFSDLLVDQPAWLVLVGDVSPTERDQTARARLARVQSDDADAARRTVQLGYRQDIPEVLAATDIFVLPSYREGMPVSVLEAMACGVPVITTDVRGCREAVAGGEAGIIVPARDPAALAEALRELAADPEERQRLGSAGRALVEERNTTARSVAPLTALYRHIEASEKHSRRRSGGSLRAAARRVVPQSVRNALRRPDRWRIVVQHVDHPFSDKPALTTPVFSEEALDEHGLAFVADPFAVQRDGTWYLFFEQLRKGAARAEIGVATSVDLRNWSYGGIVLAEPFHLSYPHIYESGGAVYMLPEASASGSVRLYRAERFPYEWKVVKCIVGGAPYKDSTLLRHGEHLFLFSEASIRHTHDLLRLFVASDLEGPWTEHPASPLILRDANAARPAGRVLNVDDHLVRVTQCCSERYGQRVSGRVIEELSPTQYRESTTARTVLRPQDWGPDAVAAHHIDAHPFSDRWIRFVDGHS